MVTVASVVVVVAAVEGVGSRECIHSTIGNGHCVDGAAVVLWVIVVGSIGIAASAAMALDRMV